MNDSLLRDGAKKWLINISSDPITKALVERSHLTKIQLETFLIDVLVGKTIQKPLTYEKKAKLRLITSGVSRGAFNRTLTQSRNNIIKSIYTIILLGYLGILETPNLEPYIEIANRIQTYTESYRELWKSKKVSDEHLHIVNMLQNEIEKTLRELSQPKEMSRKM
jgi:hypothetical protein